MTRLILLPILATVFRLLLVTSVRAAPDRPRLFNTTQNATVCPPPGFDSARDLNLSAYVSAPWYVQKQQPNSYQRASALFCARALYKPFNASDLSQGLEVLNYANRGRVNGPAVGTGFNDTVTAFKMGAVPAEKVQRSFSALPLMNNSVLSAVLGSTRDVSFDPATSASKLVVGSEMAALRAARGGLLSELNLDRTLGPYWILAVGSNIIQRPNEYDWALVSGGAPVYASSEGCSTTNPMISPSRQYRGGLWIFSRFPVDPIATAAAMTKAKGLGLDISQLVDVEQKGCEYAGAQM